MIYETKRDVWYVLVVCVYLNFYNPTIYKNEYRLEMASARVSEHVLKHKNKMF